jgi:hypothetical protein
MSDAKNYSFEYVFFIRTDQPIESALQAFVDKYNVANIPQGDPPYDYTLNVLNFESLEGKKVIWKIEHTPNEVGDEYDILASATQEKGIITLTSIDIMIADQVLEILLHLFSWNNVKWIMIGEW